MTECDKDCRTCLDDPDSECITKHPKVWMEFYEPVLKNCEKDESEIRSCEGLRLLLKALVHNKYGATTKKDADTVKESILGLSRRESFR